MGLQALSDDADEYGKRVINAILNLTERYRAEAVKAGKTELAKVLERVPRYGATSFYEALQSFRLSLIHI